MPILVRYMFGIPIAVMVTLGLFMLMRYLVVPIGFEKPEEGDNVRISITREHLEEPDTSSNRKPPKPEKQDTPPPPPPAARPKVAPEVVSDAISIPGTNSGGEIGLNTDRDAQPLVRIEPRYPENAAARGLEGWVLVQFDVTSDGTTHNCRVVDADPKGVFNRAACRAVSRWRYQPKIVDGEPAPRAGVQTIFNFVLEEAG